MNLRIKFTLTPCEGERQVSRGPEGTWAHNIGDGGPKVLQARLGDMGSLGPIQCLRKDVSGDGRHLVLMGDGHMAQAPQRHDGTLDAGGEGGAVNPAGDVEMCSQVAKRGAHWETGVAGAPPELPEEGSCSLVRRADEAFAWFAILWHGKSGACPVYEFGGEMERVGKDHVTVLTRSREEEVVRENAGARSCLPHEVDPW